MLKITMLNKLSSIEYNDTIQKIKDKISEGFPQMNISKWEQHWNNIAHDLLQKTTISLNDLRPRYDNHKIYRYMKYLYKSTADFEFKKNIAIRQNIFNQYISNDEHVFDFGCGTGINAMLIKNITCLDFVTSMSPVINKINTLANFELFDMTNPHLISELKNAVVVTCHSMEQIGKNFYDFIKMIEQQKPRICIHIEPIIELYNSDELDMLAIKYHRSRNYLEGFLTYLLNSDNKIVEIKRSYFGSLYHEGYSVVVWQPQP